MLPVNGSHGLASLAEPANRLSTLFDRFVNDEMFTPSLQSHVVHSVPLAMWEDHDKYSIEIDAPGISENDLEVSICNGELIIKGERRREQSSTAFDSRKYGCFMQRINLPHAAMTDKVDAKLVNGVLSISFPKVDEAKPRRIPLRTG